MNKKSVHVAIAIIRQRDQILLGWRDEQLHQGGKYEFPGGKVEPNETVEAAIKREVLEEVGIKVEISRLFEKKHFDYGDKELFLEFFICDVLANEILKITAPWQWVKLQNLKQYTFPAANQSVIDQLVWSEYLAISALDTNFKQRLPKTNLCYLRKPNATLSEIEHDVAALTERQIKVILNINHFEQLSTEWQQKVFALHVNSTQLYQVDLRACYPQHQILAACHSEQDILQANVQACDAILISPVQHTASHPEQKGLGWDAFKQLAQKAHMPIYALGGLKQNDLEIAQQHQAYGVAGITDFF